jgi:hypothetical protein
MACDAHLRTNRYFILFGMLLSGPVGISVTLWYPFSELFKSIYSILYRCS